MARNIVNVVIGSIRQHGQILLGLKEPKMSWAQYGSPLRWVLLGGKVENGESEREAFARELKEEIRVSPCMSATEKVAIILMKKMRPDGTFRMLRIHMFLAGAWLGVPGPTREITSFRWCNNGALPFYVMLAVDKVCMPMILAGQKIIVHAVVDAQQKHLLAPLLIRKVKCFPVS